MNYRNIMMAGVLTLLAGTQAADACSRVLYVGDTTATGNEEVLRIVGRSLDWSTPIPTNIFVYPRGIEKQSAAEGSMFRWTSVYGAVYATSYNAGITEGMNEKGLTVNGLFCRQAIYNNPSTEDKPVMSLAVFPAYLLDLCATTDEAVALVRQQNFKIAGATFDGGTASTLHWGITDATGKSAVIEFNNGHIKIYEGRDLPVLTNDPLWPAMNAIDDYWEGIGGASFLPGGVRSADRFVRAHFFDNSVERTNDADTGLAIIRSILYNVSVPYKYVKGDKNLSQTQWRSFSNIRDRKYFFENVTDPGLYYIDLNELSLSPGSPVLYLDTQHAAGYVGNVNRHLVNSEPFTRMY